MQIFFKSQIFVLANYILRVIADINIIKIEAKFFYTKL